MRLNFLKSPICLIAALVILGVCLLELYHPVAVQQLEWLTYDARVRLAHHYPNQSGRDATNLGVIEINDSSIAAVAMGEFGYKFGLYWPRQVYARGLEELTKEGAKAVAFDVIFGEQRFDQPPVELTNGENISSDQFFAGQLKSSSNAILAADHQVLPAALFRTNAWAIATISTDRDHDGVLRRDRAFATYRDWHWIIKQIEAGYSLNLSKTVVQQDKIIFFRQEQGQQIEFPLDAKGMIDTTAIVNPVPPGVPAHFHPFKDIRVWSMGVVLAARELGLDLDHPEIDLEKGTVTLRGSNGLTRVIPVDDQGYFYIDWSMGLGDPRLAEGQFADLLRAPAEREAGKTVTNQWKDKLIMVGSTATGNDLADVGSTSLEPHTFLVSKHWNVANSIISGRFVTRTSQNVDLLLIVLVGGLTAWATWVVARPINGTILIGVGSVFYVLAAILLFIQWRIWLPIILPLGCAGIVTHLGALTYRLTVEQSERKRIRSLFSRVVSPEVVNKILTARGISLGTLAGERREITIYFADIRGFTELTDAAQAEGTEFVRRHEMSNEMAEHFFDEQAKEVMNTVSLYLGIIADGVKKHNGTLDKYIGDCVMAFWGAPLANPQHAAAAVRCALEAQRSLYEINVEREKENVRRELENPGRVAANLPTLPRLPILSMGSGINTGMAIAGFMGSEAHIVNYTVFGREVNLASRLEGVSGHGRIIIGEGTYISLQRDDPELAKTCVELPAQAVKGFRERVRIFEVPWRKPGSTEPAPALTSRGENTATNIRKAG